MVATCTDNSHGALDCNGFHRQPFSRFPSLLDLARIFLPVKHMFSCTKVRRNKLHPFNKISADVFSLRYFKRSLHSQFLNFLIGEVVRGWRGCKLFWIHGSWVQEISWFASHGSALLLCASTGQEEFCARVVWSKFLEVVSTCAKRNFLTSRTPISARFGQGSMRSCRKSLHIVHSVECLHVVRMVESHIYTNRLRVHPERVHPLMILPITLDVEILLHGKAVKCDVTPSNVIRIPKVWSPIFGDPWFRKMRSPNSSVRNRSREIFLVTVSRNCRMGMSSPHVDKGHQDYPSESSSY